MLLASGVCSSVNTTAVLAEARPRAARAAISVPVSVAIGVSINQGELAGLDAVAGAKHVRPGELLSVDQAAVGASQVAGDPLVPFALQRQVLARQPRHAGIGQLIGRGAPQTIGGSL